MRSVESKARFARQRALAIRQGARDYIKTLGLIKQAREVTWDTCVRETGLWKDTEEDIADEGDGNE